MSLKRLTTWRLVNGSVFLNKFYCTKSDTGKDGTHQIGDSTSTKSLNEVPEAPTNCCMSGCANCVWLKYAEDLMNIFGSGDDKIRKHILEKVDDPNMRAFLEMELRNIQRNKT